MKGRRAGRGGSGRSGTAPVLVWGRHPVRECLRARPGAAVRLLVVPSFGRRRDQAALLALAERTGCPVEHAEPTQAGVPPGAVHQGVALEVRPFWWRGLEELPALWGAARPLVVVCDQVTDPGNLGALIRSAAGLGAQAVLLPRRRNVPVTGHVFKASAGAVAHVALVEVDNVARTLEVLKEMGLWVAGLDPAGPAAVWAVDLVRPLALVVGSEGRGLRVLVRRACDLLLAVPQAGGTASLNVAVALGAALYEVRRQWAAAGGGP
ncbi:23S rRNA (guanosine(2251)-2'-O)-methyltransferase RlmB [Dissulfurirhabdus thermomarina]|uniref:23S rRNA (Guanosine(2251)-2'-O)-methyltransferase RlmB n=1 Tax=Dissulfurirhabdus thermomarina TaxID=1765737 RepID=A0A6N9TMH6_DISTH|nr:23S rRNA (guanosine(2251)-2'-O)-methyltransferase RlmB [Dissulfurirhabdus thermomarina]NDY41640.1 23S rRNA (guanosine(2251)-2'-O)-methyltransferase RlmB [Dissulfurirhabdus thermomarina]NMX23317.1 23S rRNA (guanosine(2251)-2'-O)-methyltransferase RlmB [Dissulfurirhabdus thermomarina]